MIYRPQEKTAEDILEAAGFSYDRRSSAGWVKYFDEPPVIKREPGSCVIVRASKQTKKKNMDRLHALMREGDIHLHYDSEIRGKHVSGQRGNMVKKFISKFQKIDYEKEEIPVVAEGVHQL